MTNIIWLFRDNVFHWRVQLFSPCNGHKICIFASLSEEKSLRDDEILQNLPVGTTATMYFRDLGPQLGWTMVRRAHSAQRLLMYYTEKSEKKEKKSVSGHISCT